MRAADDTTLMAESEEELKGLLMKVKEKSEKVGLKLTLCDTMDCSTPGFPVHHQLPKTIQSHVHRLGDAIQPSHPLSSPYPLALKLNIQKTKIIPSGPITSWQIDGETM